MLMMRGLVLALLAACQPLGDATGELAGVGDGKRIYLDMKLGGARVMQEIKFSEGRFGKDKAMPAKIYALSYAGHRAENLQLSGEKVNFNKLITFTNVVLAWNYEKSASPVYTCHLHSVSLGEQRGIIARNSKEAKFCFVEQVGTTASSADFAEQDGDYVRLLADYCLAASGESSRFIFLEGKDFACDLSDDGDGSSVLHASCLAKGNESCLDGSVRACAVQTVGFENFVETFKQHVTAACNEEGCPLSYALKEQPVPDNAASASNAPPASNAATATTDNKCSALAPEAEGEENTGQGGGD